jgi:hypothetical protein
MCGVKTKFGDSLRSKTDVAQVNETFAKVLCHNLVVLIHEMYELGIEPIFWAESSPTQEVARLLREHLVRLGRRLALSLVLGEQAWATGFLLALARLPRVLKGRVVEESKARAKDENVLCWASEARAGLV